MNADSDGLARIGLIRENPSHPRSSVVYSGSAVVVYFTSQTSAVASAEADTNVCPDGANASA